MRCLYRERRYHCGNYLEVDIFPVFQKQSGRGKKAKPTSEVQARLNEHNAEQKLIRILNANFTPEDIEIHLTYTDENLPSTPEEAERDVANYLRRVKRLRKKLELPALKYVNVPGGGIGGTRFHFHITMSGGVFSEQMAAGLLRILNGEKGGLRMILKGIPGAIKGIGPLLQNI